MTQKLNQIIAIEQGSEKSSLCGDYRIAQKRSEG